MVGQPRASLLHSYYNSTGVALLSFSMTLVYNWPKSPEFYNFIFGRDHRPHSDSPG